MVGLRCNLNEDPYGNPLPTGPEQCICGCNHLAIPEEDECKETLCKEGEYCISDLESCFSDCLDFPHANEESCYCLGDACVSYSGEMVYCKKTSGIEGDQNMMDFNISRPSLDEVGCYIPEDCPQDFTIFKDSVLCDCNGTIIFTNSSYCMDDIEFPLPTEECPPFPDNTSVPCLCNDTLVCEEGLMCNDMRNTCEERPEPCPSLPEVASFWGCYCEAGHEICQLGQTCGGEDSTCYEPAKCGHPESRQDWSSFLATITTVTALNENNSAIESSILGVQCHHNTFREDLIEQSDTFVNQFDVQCTQDGSWSGLEKCKFPLCEQLEFDTNTVRSTLWGDREQTKVRHGSIEKLECATPGHTFEGYEKESRFFYHCFKKKWNVTETSLCQDKESCETPTRVSCSFKGCSPLQKSFQERVVYDPILPSYLSGSSLTVSCSNQVEPLTRIEAYMASRQVFAVKKKTYNIVHQTDQSFCLHDDCLSSIGKTWMSRNEESGKDCLQEDSKAFCIKSSKIKWNGSLLHIDGKKINIQCFETLRCHCKAFFSDYCDESSRSIHYPSLNSPENVLKTDTEPETEESSWNPPSWSSNKIFIMDMGCPHTFENILVKNSHNHENRDTSSKKLK